MREKDYLLVINPKSGRKGKRYLEKLTSVLERNSIAYFVYYTHSDVSLDEEKLAKLIREFSDVVSIGGDGTLNMLCNVLAGKNIPLGIIPCGTGNDYVKNIYSKKDDVLSTVTGTKFIHSDLGICNERYFINVLGVGYDALVARASSARSKIMFRSLFYLWNAVKFLPGFKEVPVDIKSEKFNKNEAAFMVAFGNGAFFGSGMNITPHADITDGQLDCCWVGKLSMFKKCHCLLKIFSGAHLHEMNIEYTQGKEFHILSADHPIEADGEFIGYSPASVRVAEKALLVKVP